MNRFISIISISILIISCSNEVEIHVKGDPLPAVYCLLNPDAPIQYIRVGRSFQSSYAIINQEPLTDSTIWKLPIQVFIEQWQDDKPEKIYQFESYTGPIKDSGFFPNNNLRLYKSTFQAKHNTKYHLYVYFPDTDKAASAWTITPGPVAVGDPNNIPGRTITFLPSNIYTLRWKPSINAGVYQGEFTIYIKEIKDAEWFNSTVSFTTQPYIDLYPESLVSRGFNGKHFYNALIADLDTDPDITRTIYSLQYRFITGGRELAYAITNYEEESQSFLSSEAYSNIHNGIGLFSTLMYTTVPNLNLSNVTKDTLAYSKMTRHLGFLDHNGKR